MGATMMDSLRKYWQALFATVVTFCVVMVVAAPAASASTDETDEASVVQTTDAQKTVDDEAPQSDASDQSTADDPPDGGGDNSSSSDLAPKPEPEPEPAPQQDNSDNSEDVDQGSADSDEGSADDQSNSSDADQDQSDDTSSQASQESSQEAAPTTMEQLIEAVEVLATPSVTLAQGNGCVSVIATVHNPTPTLTVYVSIYYGDPGNPFDTGGTTYGPGLTDGQQLPDSAVLPPEADDFGYPVQGIAVYSDGVTGEQVAIPLDTSCLAPTPVDSDGDGINDKDDQCPNEAGPASNNGCPVILPPVDSDNDGVSDNVDQCLGTPANAPVDANGCADSQKDSDGDGKTDDVDQCPGTQPGFTVDENGCIVCPPGTHPIDAESDGIVNDCEPDVPADVTVPKPTQPGVIDPPGPSNVSYEPQEDTDSVDWVLNPDGSYDANAKPGHVFDDGSKTVHFDAPTDSYDPNTYDQDGDGVVDAVDKCPDTPAGTPVGVNGCPIQVTPVDSDGDGLPDYLDRCPNVAGSTPSGCPPIVVPVPTQPSVTDPPGPSNIYWNVPVSTSVVTWTVLGNGNLLASVASGDYRFADGSFGIEFCLPADSYVPPAPPAPTAGPTNAVPDYVGTGEGDTGVQSTMHFRVIVALILSLLAGACVVVFRRRVTE